MPIRFSSRSGRSNDIETRRDGFGEGWAAVAGITMVATAILSLSGSAEPPAAVQIDLAAQVLAALNPARRSLVEIESAFESLCQEPVLLALELEPDCESGVITLSDDLFERYGKGQLKAAAREDVAVAMTTYLASLRRMPAIWESLDAIEIRGHADPRALRNPYSTNLLGSQQRALGVLLFLVGPDGVSELDRSELQRFAVVSGVSFTRPPETCPERSSECYPQWRRVEIRPILSESLRRGDWSRTVQDIQTAALRAQQEPDEQ